jgi:hypothetical protein
LKPNLLLRPPPRGNALFVGTGVLAYRTILASPSNRHQVSSSSMMDCTSTGLPPDPAPINGRNG